MDFMQNFNIDNSLLICGKDESHSKYLELLFENKKRSGGEEMIQFYHDKKLSQYLIVYRDQQTLEDVINHGHIIYNNERFIPMRVDKTKFIIENLDQGLEKDILFIYAENLLQDIPNFKCSIEHLFSEYFMVTCDKEIDFDRLKERFKRHHTIQNKELTLHLVAKLNSNDVTYKQNEYRNLYFNIMDQASPSSPNRSEASNEINDEGFIEVLNKIYIDDSDTSNNSSNMTSISTRREKVLEDRIKFLENQLKLYKNFKSVLSRINKLSQECATSIELDVREAPVGNTPTSPINVPNPTQSIISSLHDNEPSQNESNRVQNNRWAHLFQKRSNFHKRSSVERQPIERERPEEIFLSRNITQNKPTLNLKTNRGEASVREGLNRLQALNTRLKQDITESRRNFYDRFESDSRPQSVQHFRRTMPEVIRGRGMINTAWEIPTSSPSSTSSSRNASPILDILRSLNTNQTGLSDQLINRFPIIKYRQPTALNDNLSDIEDELNSKQTNCLICLEQLIENDEVRLLSCFHQFHVGCIDTWLKEKSICPCCKSCLRKSLISTY